MKRTMTAVCLLFFLAFGAASMAWGSQQGEPQNRQRLRERISDLYLLRLTRALELTEEQTARIYPLLTRAEKDKAELQRRMSAGLQALRAHLAQDRPKEETLILLTNGVREAREDIRRIEAEVDAALDDVLTPLQRARYVVFTVEFLRGTWENLERARGLRAPLKRTP